MQAKEEIITQLQNLYALQQRIINRVLEKSTEALSIEGVALTEENINQRITELANTLIKEAPASPPVLVSIMDGAMPFATKLYDALFDQGYQFQYTNIQASSYHGGTKSSGKVEIQPNLKIPVGGKTVILVDDVCDSGRTCKRLKDFFLSEGAIEVRLMVLVDKVQQRDQDCEPDYSGFKLSKDDFIIGMGLDLDSGLRELPYIRIVDLASLATPEEQKKLDKIPELNKQLKQVIAEINLCNFSETKEAFFATTADVPINPAGASSYTLN